MRAMPRTIAFMLACWGTSVVWAEGFDTWHVDWSHTTGTIDGTTWGTAYPTLQQALGVADAGDLILVRGCSGTCDGDDGVYSLTTLTESFLIDGLTIVGGMDGSSGDPENSDPETYVTTLSGKLTGEGEYAEHVVKATDEGVLTGFVIESGRALGESTTTHSTRGGGILIVSASPTISNCLIRNNQASGAGGGVYVHAGDPTIEYCTFESNTAGTDGGGLYFHDSDGSIDLCSFEENTAAARGGGLMVAYGNPIVSVCTLQQNEAGASSVAGNDGGGAYIYNSAVDILSCDFTGNTAAYAGGGLTIAGEDDDPVVDDCVFVANDAADRGGGLYVYNASPDVDDSIFEDNTALSGGGAFVHIADDKESACGPQFLRCDFWSNIAGLGGGGGATCQTNVLEGQEENDATAFTDCNFIDNRISYIWANYCAATSLGAGMFISGSPTLTGCLFEGNGPWNNDFNESMINGGGVAINNYIKDGADEWFYKAEFVSCIFRHNGHVIDLESAYTTPSNPGGCSSTYLAGHPSSMPEADFVNHGGGVYIQRSSNVELEIFPNPFVDGGLDATFENCIFIGNVAGNGGGVFMDRAAATFDGCCWMDNDADGRTAHVWWDGGNCTGTMCYQQAAAAYGGGAISTYRLSKVTATNCKFAHNRASLWSGGAIYVYQGSTMIADRCYFVGNSAPSALDTGMPHTNVRAGAGGAIWVNSNCFSNYGPCDDDGPGVGFRVAYAKIYNCLLAGNFAEGDGGAMQIERAGWSDIVNCTIMSNEAGGHTGGVVCDSVLSADYLWAACFTQIYNSIVWANTDGQWPTGDQREQVYDVQLDSMTPPDWPVAGRSCITSNGTPALAEYEWFGPGNNTASHPKGSAASFPVILDSGTWTSAPTYNPATGLTTFTDSTATVTGWTNRILLTRSSGAPATFEERSVIVSVNNSSHTITVLGDLSHCDLSFDVEDYLIDVSSPCHDTGDELYLPTPFNIEDILGNDRIVGEFDDIDMGCYENGE